MAKNKAKQTQSKGRSGALSREPKTEQKQQTQQTRASQTNTNRGANKDTKSGPSKWTRTGPGTYKDQYGNVLKGQKTAPKRDMSQRGQNTGQTTQTPTGPTPESVTEEGFMGAGEAYQGIVDRFQGFDPYQMQQQYEPGFQQEMERARQNVMGQFERRNQRQFEQQRTSLQQQIAERGLDPASPAAQELMRQQNEREDMARQEALSAAEQAAYSVQQQGFGQAGQLAMMPYEQWQAIQQPYIAGIGAQYQQEQLSAQQQFEREQQRRQLASAERIARMSRGGGGGGGQQGPTLYERMEAEALGRGYGQGQQQNPWANVAQGVATGASAGITNWALK